MNDGLLTTWRQAVAEDLRLIALLHDRELDRPLLQALAAAGFPDSLGLHLGGERAEGIRALLGHPQPAGAPYDDNGTLDALAADFAAIYLNHTYRASPCESVWLDDEGLMRQEPMFQVRGWYERHGLSVKDWGRRPDDHLVPQLQFVAHLAAQGNDPMEHLRQAAHFLDEHPLRWLPRFAERVTAHCATPFYAGLAQLTTAYLEQLRDLLAVVAEVPRPDPEALAQRLRPRPAPEVPLRYVPGAEASW